MDYLPLLRENLTEKRFLHSLEVSREAVRLAHKFGADPQKAELAGLLHDICKDMEPQRQLQIIKEFGIMMNNVEKGARKLWHAIAGRAYLERELHVTDTDILNAVRYHTTARAGMSLLEKVIYIADFTSLDRDYDGVDKMREQVEHGMDACMEEALTYSIVELVDSRKCVHPDTVAAYNERMLGM